MKWKKIALSVTWSSIYGVPTADNMHLVSLQEFPSLGSNDIWALLKKKLAQFQLCRISHPTANVTTQTTPSILPVLLKTWFQSGTALFISKSLFSLKGWKSQTQVMWSRIFMTEPQWRFSKVVLNCPILMTILTSKPLDMSECLDEWWRLTACFRFESWISYVVEIRFRKHENSDVCTLDNAKEAKRASKKLL